MAKRKTTTRALATRQPSTPSLAIDSAKKFEVALKAEQEKRKMIQKFIKSQLIEGVDYGVIEIKSKKTGKCFLSKPTIFKSGTEKFASLLNLRPVFVEDELTMKQLPESIKEQGVLILKCELQNAKGVPASEGRGAATFAEFSNDINKAVKICQKRAQADAVLRLGLSDSFTQDLDDEGNKYYYETKKQIGIDNNQPTSKIQPKVKPRAIPELKTKEELKEYFNKRYKIYIKLKKPCDSLNNFCNALDIMEPNEIKDGIERLEKWIAAAKKEGKK